jgi:cytochrome c oxidase assembly protein subunit 15
VRAAAGLLALIFVQALLGALVAGTDAGRIYTDWPTMGGELLAPVDWSLGARAFLHDQALVQFVHRTGAYVVLAFVTAYAILTARSRPAEGVGFAAYLLAGGVWLQAALGVATLMNAVPLWLGVLHQLGAAIVVVLATFNLWKVRRSQARLFSSRGL